MKREYEGIPIREFLFPVLLLTFFVGYLIFVFVSSCSRCNSVYDKPDNDKVPQMLKEHLESDVPKG